MMLFLREILESLSRNRSRTIISGIGISWGIFVLMLLIGVGNGLETGLMDMFSDFAQNTTYVYSGETRTVYHSLPINRHIFFDDSDIELIRHHVASIKHISPECSSMEIAKNGDKAGYFHIVGVGIDYFKIRFFAMLDGRLLNNADYRENRKVAVIGKNVADVLFSHQNPVGQMLNIGGISYTIVGVVKNSFLGNQDERSIFIPLAVFSATHNRIDKYETVLYSLNDVANEYNVQERIRCIMSRKYEFLLSDDGVFYFNSMEDAVKQIKEMFSTIKKFLWFMGLNVLISGVVGIGNTMCSNARERIQEIGIRKSVGATVTDIKYMFMCETIFLIVLSGVCGLGASYIVLLAIDVAMPADALISAPGFDMPTAIGSLVVLVLSGVIVGIQPAIKAAEQDPIVSLRN